MVDYTKWDKMAIDDDEATPLDDAAVRLDSRREALRIEVAAALTSEPADGALLAYFVAAQHRDADAPDNRTRHSEVIALLSRSVELVAPETTEALCRAAAARFEASDERLGRILVEALNTLEAARRCDGALPLFESICSPSDARALALREAYARHKFGELRLKRHVFRNVDSAEMRQAMEEHEQRELGGAIDLPQAAIKAEASNAGRIIGSCFALAAVLGGGLYVMSSMRR
ncbi:hypothetical protein M885DRAFT_506423 [Pelagophyceae sp. CCMP2097]|nr:hypothetical protein M885DRAFT_506423 [Pelagophyceae sp. CCMP2097]|mmetsp:Transcript_11005/g.38215  ORF Transcript_11005/g.38215 Transcript_11005/m.38215 type:complete len:231 (-) Transcript_11005:321-1013(-)